jgi:hypothetical protein
MVNVRGKSIDNTHLSIDLAEERGLIHRDYMAHCMRWSHVAKSLYKSGFYQGARLLDIGCGVDIPLAKMLYSNRLLIPEYIGIDYNAHHKFDVEFFANGRWKPNTFGSVDFASSQVWFDKAADGQNLLNIKGDNREDYFMMPNIVTCFEVVEHIEPSHVRALLDKVHKMLSLCHAQGLPTRFYLSTPNWDVVHCADNHVNEMKHEALGWAIENAGFNILERYGTFASQTDYKQKLFSDYASGRELYEKLSKYYDSNYVSTLFAPLYPAEARNCLWVLGVGYNDKPRLFPELEFNEDHPWTSSANWKDLDANRTNPETAYSGE